MMFDMKMHLLWLTWIESWNHALKGIIEVYFQKNRSKPYYVRYTTKLDWSKTTKHFSVKSDGKFLCRYQASRLAREQADPSFPFWDFQILFSLLGCYFSGIFCTFHLRQMFIGFLKNTFDFYWNLTLHFSYISW